MRRDQTELWDLQETIARLCVRRGSQEEWTQAGLCEATRSAATYVGQFHTTETSVADGTSRASRDVIEEPRVARLEQRCLAAGLYDRIRRNHAAATPPERERFPDSG